MSHYSLQDAQHYAAHHQKSLRTRLTTFRERRLLASALRQCGQPASILDIPCGAGRFWQVLFGSGIGQLIAADNSDGMLSVARESWAQESERLQLLNTSVFAIDLPDRAVDVVCCLRFFHHVALPADRHIALRELHRVAGSHVIVSLWVDGNLQSRRRMRRDALRTVAPGFGPRRCLSRADFERECADVGFTVKRHWDVAPGWSMWRFYLLGKS